MEIRFLREFSHNSIIIHVIGILCADKLLKDGYIDVFALGDDNFKRNDAIKKLHYSESRYSILFDNQYLDDKVLGDRMERAKDSLINLEDDGDSYKNMSLYEAKCLFAWVNVVFGRQYRVNKVSFQFWIDAVRTFLELQGDNEWKLQVNEELFIIYDARRIELTKISGTEAYLKKILKMNDSMRDKAVFFRGHSSLNYQLLPSIMRRDFESGQYKLMHREQSLYNELQYKCYSDFEKCKTHLERLSIMQHYSMPTRLLDITSNALVALYFACVSNKHWNIPGEVITLSIDKNSIKWPGSDTVSVLSSIPALSNEDKNGLSMEANRIISKNNYCVESTITPKKVESNPKNFLRNDLKCTKKLIGEIRTEKPGFEERILKRDISARLFVYANKTNKRIINQKGAFILFGEPKHNREFIMEPCNEYRVKNKNDKVCVLCIINKKKILDEVKILGIDNETMFPEIDNVARAIL